MNRFALLLLAIAIGAVLTFSGCSLDLENFGAPVWTVEATIPFSERVYVLSELVTDTTRYQERGWGVFVNDSDSLMRFEYFEEIEPQIIGDKLKYDASDVGQYVNDIGTISIDDPPLEGNRVVIDEVSDDIRPSEDPVIIPPFTFNQSEKELEFEVYKWVAVNAGQLNIRVWNHFPFAIENLVVSIQNYDRGDEIGLAVFAQPILAGEFSEQAIDLTQKYVENKLLLVADGRTPGTLPGAVKILEGANMTIEVQISDLEVDSAHAEVGFQDFAQGDEIDLEDDDKIVEAQIQEGTAYFRLRNTMPLRVFADLEFQNITDDFGLPIIQTVTLDPGSETEIYELDLSGKHLRMDLDHQVLMVDNEVSVEDSRETMYQDSSYQTVSGDQGVEISYWTNELTLDSFTGILYKIEFDIPEQSTEIELPKGSKDLNFTRDTLFIDLQNDTELMLQLTLNVIGRNSENGDEYILEKVKKRIVLPGENRIVIPDVSDLTQVVPDQILFNGFIGLGTHYFPEEIDSVREVRSDQGFYGQVLLKSAFRLTIGETVFLTEPFEIEEDLNFPIQSVELNVNVVNNAPIAGMVRLLMGNDITAMDTLIQASLTRPELLNYRVLEPVVDNIEIVLNKEQLEIAKRLPLFTQQQIILYSSEEDTVWIHAADYISVKAWGTVHYFVDPNAEGN